MGLVDIMESSGLQRLFYVSWTIIKLNLFFVAGTFMGLIILGVGPSFQTMNDMIMEYGIDYTKMTWKKFFEGWKLNFKRGNIFFWIFLSSLLMLLYSLYISAQLQGLIWMIIDFILIFASIALVEFYIYLINYQTSYDASIFDIIKLSFVSLFFNFGTFIKLFFGIGSILVLTWYFKGLILFATFSLILIFAGYATKENRELVDGKLA